MNIIIGNHKPEFDQAVENFKKEILSIRTGRANPAMVENIQVEVYGSMTPLIQLASISVPEARTIVIQPWDKNVTKDIERAIIQNDLGLTPVNEGNLIRLTISQMTEESRIKFVKLLQEKTETARINIRGVRDRTRDKIITAERNKEITEDDRYQAQKDLDELTREYNDKIKDLSQVKEKEITTI